MSDNLELVQRVSKLEEKTYGHSKRIDNLEDNNKELSKLSILMEVQIEMNQKQQEQMERQHETLVKVNQNLDGLNTGLQDVNERVGKLEETDKSKKIDLSILGKDIVFKVIPTVIATLVGAWLMIHFGMSKP